MFKRGVEGTIPTLQTGIWSQFNPGWTSSEILLFSTLLPGCAYCTVISTGMSPPTTTQPFKLLIKSNPIHLVTLYPSALALSLCYLILTAPWNRPHSYISFIFPFKGKDGKHRESFYPKLHHYYVAMFQFPEPVSYPISKIGDATIHFIGDLEGIINTMGKSEYWL